MRRTSKAGAGLALGMLLFAPSSGQAGVRTPVVTTPRFAFYSDFEPNLNDALIAAGVARKPGKPELFHSGTEAPCFDKLPESARAAWDGAVDYYAKIISPAGSNARQQYLLRVQLTGFDEELKDNEARQFVEIARSFRAAATPAYRACRWASQDEKNRRWIEELKPRLTADEQKIGPELEKLYRMKWTGLPIPVDVVETVDWSGASPSIGRAAITAAAQGFMTAFPDMVVKMNDVSLEGVHAIYRWTLTGTNTGPGGTGKAIRIRGYEEWAIGADALIVESRGHFDEAEYQRQLKSGAAPSR
jgi:SnoaL-like polyketide cyclase